MQSVAAEMNLSETAFVRPLEDGLELRWFTPTMEVDLCGHATLGHGSCTLVGRSLRTGCVSWFSNTKWPADMLSRG